MDVKPEGPAFPPVPITGRAREARRGELRSGEAGGLPCEMCGSAVVTWHCKVICLRCGFMTGCSEGI
jgi:hypothetical protein